MTKVMATTINVVGITLVMKACPQTCLVAVLYHHLSVMIQVMIPHPFSFTVVLLMLVFLLINRKNGDPL